MSALSKRFVVFEYDKPNSSYILLITVTTNLWKRLIFGQKCQQMRTLVEVSLINPHQIFWFAIPDSSMMHPPPCFTNETAPLAFCSTNFSNTPELVVTSLIFIYFSFKIFFHYVFDCLLIYFYFFYTIGMQYLNRFGCKTKDKLCSNRLTQMGSCSLYLPESLALVRDI